MQDKGRVAQDNLSIYILGSTVTHFVGPGDGRRGPRRDPHHAPRKRRENGENMNFRGKSIWAARDPAD